MRPLARWLEVLSPGSGHLVGGAFEDLTIMPVYRVPPDCAPSREGATLQCAEFSLRAHAGGVDRARLMVALWAPWVRAGGVAAALERLAPLADRAVLAGIEAVRADHPELDLLIGVEAAGERVRGKLYVMRPTPDVAVDFDEIAVRVLGLTGVSASWVRRCIGELGRSPAFVASDLLGARESAGKLYFGFDGPEEAREHLVRLGSPWLTERLDEVVRAVSDNPVNRLVLTLRGRGDRTVDLTLHAHTRDLPALGPELMAAWSSLGVRARELLGRPLTPSYVSWLDGEKRAESLYYQVGLTEAELASAAAPAIGGAPIRPDQGLDGTRAGPVYLSPADLAKLASSTEPPRPREPVSPPGKQGPDGAPGGLRPGPDGTPGGRKPGPDSQKEVRVSGPVGFPGFPRPRRTRPPGVEQG
jgi:hypothetical protein